MMRPGWRRRQGFWPRIIRGTFSLLNLTLMSRMHLWNGYLCWVSFIKIWSRNSWYKEGVFSLLLFYLIKLILFACFYTTYYFLFCYFYCVLEGLGFIKPLTYRKEWGLLSQQYQYWVLFCHFLIDGVGFIKSLIYRKTKEVGFHKVNNISEGVGFIKPAVYRKEWVSWSQQYIGRSGFY